MGNSPVFYRTDRKVIILVNFFNYLEIGLAINF